DGNSLDSVLWTDAQGRSQKSVASSNRMVSYRTTRQIALAPGGPARFDLALDTLVKLNKPLEKPHQTRQVRYRVTVEDGDPTRLFPAGPTQRIKPVDEHTIELTVRSRRPDEKLPEGFG